MKELKLINLHKTYGTKTLLDGVDLAIRTGDKVGLIGVNGAGKSSMLKVIAGTDSYDAGEITKPNDYTIAYLDQHPQFDRDKTILQTVYDSAAPQIQLLLKYEEIRMNLEANPEDQATFDRFNRVTEEMNRQNAWDAEVQAKTILGKLGLIDLNRTLATCSGGERKRIGIAQVLITQADLLILDEPTNHLDIDSIAWLETYLANYKGALLLVTHDRYFLEKAVNKIVELRHGMLYEYTGSYSQYLEQRQAEMIMSERMQEKQDRLYDAELAWMRKGAKARTTKQQARIQRFEALKSDIGSRDQDANALELDFNQQRIGQRIIDVEDIKVEIGDQVVIDGFTRNFVKGDRIGIIGDNGVGKTTFLNTLAGFHPITEGEYHVGQTVRMAYYRQLDEDLPNNMRVLNYLTQVADDFRREDGSRVSASQLLEQFNFPRANHGMEIRSLSGGERRRLYLLTLLIQEPNVLFLDEPTNDLDIETLQVLEDYLETFQGVVIIVSHDRYFLDKTVDQIVEIQGGGTGAFTHFYGNYSEYIAQKPDESVGGASGGSTGETNGATTGETKDKTAGTTASAETVSAGSPSRQSDAPQRMTYYEKKEWDTLEEDIMAKEMKADELREDMNHQGSNAEKLMEIHETLEKLDEEILHLYERYDYLSQLKY